MAKSLLLEILMLIPLLMMLFSFRAQAQVLEIDPSHVDPATHKITSPHLALTPKTDHQNGKLLIMIGGTWSITSDYLAFGQTAANMGFHVLIVDYPNGVISTVCRDKPTPDCADRFREEVVTGKDVSDRVNVNPANSILHRIRSSLVYLGHQNKDWQAFYNSDVGWDRVVIAGHSQGSGHAAYLSKEFRMSGVILIAGPQDATETGLAHWLTEPGKTPADAYHALLHKTDHFGSVLQMKAVMELIKSGAPGGTDPNVLIVSDKVAADGHNAIVRQGYTHEWEQVLSFASLKAKK